MFPRYLLFLLFLCAPLLGDDLLADRAIPRQSPRPISLERYRERVGEVLASVDGALERIAARERSGKPFPESAVADRLRRRQAALRAESESPPTVYDLVQLDQDAIVSAYAEELANTGERAAALRGLSRRSMELSRGWIVRDENDPLLEAQGAEVELEVANRNFLFGKEAGLTPNAVAALDRSRGAFIDEQVGTPLPIMPERVARAPRKSP